MMKNSSEPYISLIVPKGLVKKTKDALQAQGKFHKKLKISPISEGIPEGCIVGHPGNIGEGSFYIPTTIRGDPKLGSANSRQDLLDLIGMLEHEADIGLVTSFIPNPASALGSLSDDCDDDGGSNPLARTISEWLATTQGTKPQTATPSLVRRHWTFTIYPPLLFLLASDFADLGAKSGLSHPSTEFTLLYGMLCKIFKVTHIALNAPIPAKLIQRPHINGIPAKPELLNDVVSSAPNVLRSPTGLTPLHGDFGPALSVNDSPTTADFQSAFWCNARQNRIFQTWAPRYTMFSRGNVKEKARILGLISLTKERLQKEPNQISAVDLYAGVGYFTFSYVKAGVGKVLCWEMNPWSVEGLRRGAEGNKWDVKTIKGEKIVNVENPGKTRIIVFEESNENAARRIDEIRDSIPQVRHVNCGYLPSSKDSWKAAIQVLDPAGGWIHAHENIAKRDIESRKVEIVEIFQSLTKKRFECKIECEHLELIKSYAPGVIHCVLDIAILPLNPV